ncbi:MAG TPA: hypothetical protein VIT43_14015 [Candidatus Dormibacteraeota bacterium]
MSALGRRISNAAGSPDPLRRALVLAGAVMIVFLAVIVIEMFLMLQQMRQLGSSLPSSAPSVSRLDAMRADLDRIQPDIHQMDARLNQIQSNTANLDPSMRDLAAKIAQLDADLAQVTAELKDVDQHVANLDRKTGPAPPLVP